MYSNFSSRDLILNSLFFCRCMWCSALNSISLDGLNTISIVKNLRDCIISYSISEIIDNFLQCIVSLYFSSVLILKGCSCFKSNWSGDARRKAAQVESPGRLSPQIGRPRRLKPWGNAAKKEDRVVTAVLWEAAKEHRERQCILLSFSASFTLKPPMFERK